MTYIKAGEEGNSFLSRSQRRVVMCFNSGYQCNCLTTGNLCEPCRMTAENKETEEVNPSNNMSAADQERRASEPKPNVSSDKVGNDRGRNWGWMLSGIICVNILILGSVLITGSAHEDIKIKTHDLQVFLLIIILLTSIWMVYYSVFTARTENAVDYKDAHAGPVWLRGGLVLFGILSIIMDIFKITMYVGYLHCDSAVKVAFPVVQLVFICAQTYFMWVHAKDCVQLQKNTACCGLMLTLATNLVLWMSAVTEESLHQTVLPKDLNITKLSFRSLYKNQASYGEDKCKCSLASCSILNRSYYYLYPFNIEYSLFAATMAYIMWKNVGRVVIEHGHHIKFRSKGICIGPIFGILLIFAGLATFIVYEIEMEKEHIDIHEKEQALMMHFVTNIVIVSLMSAVTVIGSVIYRIDHRDHVSEKNPTRNLDAGLLVGASLGQFIISYFSIVAIVATGAKDYLNGLNIAWAVMMVIQLALQNAFIIEGLHREPFHEVDESAAVVSNPYVLEHSKDLHSHEGSNTNPNPELPAHSLHGHTAEHKMSWKRRVLKEVCVFLLLGNIILWIMPAFGARPQFDHSFEIEFYKFNIWATVVNVGLPFGIFYRMHAVASLFEVFVNS